MTGSPHVGAQEPQQPQRSCIGPLQIVDHHQQRAGRGCLGSDVGERVEQPEPGSLSVAAWPHDPAARRAIRHLRTSAPSPHPRREALAAPAATARTAVHRRPPNTTTTPSGAATRAVTSRANRDLPTPGSPDTSTTGARRPSPPSTVSNADASAAARPTNGPPSPSDRPSGTTPSASTPTILPVPTCPRCPIRRPGSPRVSPPANRSPAPRRGE